MAAGTTAVAAVVGWDSPWVAIVAVEPDVADARPVDAVSRGVACGTSSLGWDEAEARGRQIATAAWPTVIIPWLPTPTEYP